MDGFSPSHTDLLLVEASEGIFHDLAAKTILVLFATTNFEFHRYLHQKQSGIEEDMVMAEKEGVIRVKDLTIKYGKNRLYPQ